MKLRVLIIILSFIPIITAIAQTRGENYKVVSDDASWCWFSDPRAVYNEDRGEQVYFGYINSKGDVVIGSKDLKTHETGTFVLHEKLQVNDHNVPSILILPDGHLLVFYTEHNGRFFMRKSKNPSDISAWEDERVIPFGGNRITYSHPIMLKEEDNRIYMFWRGSDWQQSFAYSDDLGDTWSEPQVLIVSNTIKGKARNRPYLKVSSNGRDRIDIIFTDGHPGVEPTNSVYHMYYEKGQFYQSDGRSIASMSKLPVARESVDKVYDGEKAGERSWIADVALNDQGHPVICYTRFPKDTDHRYHYAWWDGDKWIDEEICKAGGWMPRVPSGEKVKEPHYSGGIVIDHSDPSNIYLSREIDGHFEVEHWRKEKTGWRAFPITNRSSTHNIRPYAVEMPIGKSPVILWMTGYYQHYTKFDTQLRMRQ